MGGTPFYAMIGVTATIQPLFFTSKQQSAKFAKESAQQHKMSLAIVRADKNRSGFLETVKPLNYVFIATYDRKTDKVKGSWASKTDERG